MEGSEFWIQKQILLYLTNEMDLYKDNVKKLISIKEFLDFQTQFMLEVIEVESKKFYDDMEAEKQLTIYEENCVIKKCEEQLDIVNKFDRINVTKRIQTMVTQIMKTITHIYLEHERSTKFMNHDNINQQLLMATKKDLIENCILKNFRLTTASKKFLYQPIKKFFEKIYTTILDSRKESIISIIKDIMSDKNNKSFIAALRPFASRLNVYFDLDQYYRKNSTTGNLSGTCTNEPRNRRKKNEPDLLSAEVNEEKEKNDMEFKNMLIKTTFESEDEENNKKLKNNNKNNLKLPNIKNILPEIDNLNVKKIVTENQKNTEDINNLINDKYENNNNENINKILNNNNNNVNESGNVSVNNNNNNNNVNDNNINNNNNNKSNNKNNESGKLEEQKEESEVFQSNANIEEFFQEFQIDKSKSKDFFDKVFSIISTSNIKKKPSPQMQLELEEKNKRIQELQDENARLQASEKKRKPTPQMQKELEEKNKRIQELQEENEKLVAMLRNTSGIK
jgi:hypothetical protein